MAFIQLNLLLCLFLQITELETHGPAPRDDDPSDRMVTLAIEYGQLKQRSKDFDEKYNLLKAKYSASERKVRQLEDENDKKRQEFCKMEIAHETKCKEYEGVIADLDNNILSLTKEIEDMATTSENELQRMTIENDSLKSKLKRERNHLKQLQNTITETNETETRSDESDRKRKADELHKFVIRIKGAKDKNWSISN